jgi:predicted nucleic acid-binding protein
MIGLDTSAIIDLFNEDESLISLLAGINDKFCLNRINYFEIMMGINRIKGDHLEEESAYEKLFSSFPMLELDFLSCKKASDIHWDLKKIGITIDLLDYAIAGIFVTNGVDKIITRNVKHFDKIKGLKVLSY